MQASKRSVVTAGAFAGLVSRFVIAPLDVVKIRLQLQIHSPAANFTHNGPSYRGIFPTMRTIVAQEGIAGLWKGNIPAEALYLAYGASQFLTYQQTYLMITKSGWEVPESVKSFIAGATAGGLATTATYPLDLLRTRFAAQGQEKVYQSIKHSVRHIIENEGAYGFFRGLGAGIIQIVPHMGLFFMNYEFARQYLSTVQQLPSGWSDAIAGSFAATVAKTGVFPLDLIRKRLQVQGPTRQKYVHRNIPIYAGIFGTARDILSAEGLRGLYKGLFVSLVKAAPLSAVTMWTFERSLKGLTWLEERKIVL
ncbi:mitochondrial thiamine pyrophosphate carrier 1 [Morchella snyderi]|nr:mitochondrial thiamine pyrophosphate carrier 1 [Morchella snyderi]